MRKKSGLTIVELVIVLVPEFENVVHRLDQQVALRGQNKSKLHNYMRRIVKQAIWIDDLMHSTLPVKHLSRTCNLPKPLCSALNGSPGLTCIESKNDISFLHCKSIKKRH